jgi:hypothetical protein
VTGADVVLHETFKVNRAALDVGAEPPVCVEWVARCDPGLDDEPCNVSRPGQRVDHQRMQAFLRPMYEIGQS